MRTRKQILDSLERTYVDAFTRAKEAGDEAEQARLDFEFQRDQIHLEVQLDIRDLLSAPAAREGESADTDPVGGLLDTAQKIKNLTRFR